ncbi:hypothetical protein BJX76DRAFT_326251 [Aspergillus varians]
MTPSGSSYCSVSENSTSDCDSEYSSDSENKSSSSAPAPSTSPEPCTSSVRAWQHYELPAKLAYRGRGTVLGDYSFPSIAPSTADFSLLDMMTLIDMSYRGYALSNSFWNPINSREQHVNKICSLDKLPTGRVLVINSADTDPESGYLLEGYSSIISRGGIMRTRKIETTMNQSKVQFSFEKPVADYHPAAGTSGSWVVQGDELLGFVFAGYSNSPDLHMIPADQRLEDVKQFLAASTVKVASASGIEAAIAARHEDKGGIFSESSTRLRSLTEVGFPSPGSMPLYLFTALCHVIVF